MSEFKTLTEKPRPVRLIQEKNVLNAAFEMASNSTPRVPPYNEREDCWACGVCGKVTGWGTGGRALAERCCPPRTCMMADCEELVFGSDGMCAGCRRKQELEAFNRVVAKAKRVYVESVGMCDYDNPEEIYWSLEEYLDEIDDGLFDLEGVRMLRVSPVLFLAKTDTPTPEQLVEYLVERICSETDDDDGNRRDGLLSKSVEESGLIKSLQWWLNAQGNWYVPCYDEYIDVREDVRKRIAETNEDMEEGKKYVEGVDWEFVELKALV